MDAAELFKMASTGKTIDRKRSYYYTSYIPVENQSAQIHIYKAA